MEEKLKQELVKMLNAKFSSAELEKIFQYFSDDAIAKLFADALEEANGWDNQ